MYCLSDYPVRKIVPLPGTHEKEARAILERISKRVGAVVKKHHWTVYKLKEFHPKDGQLLGMNVNQSEILLRLRYGTEFIPYDEVLGTMLHELAHMDIGPHNKAFHGLVESLERDLQTTRPFAPGGRCGGRRQQGTVRDNALRAALRRKHLNQIIPRGYRTPGQ